ncbi:MAG: hypothetical protein GTN59_08745 [Candidatus Dadabacteria bacterium]|nr:hypothetical protein [Candidatus Dadabacteria bacterium]
MKYIVQMNRILDSQKEILQDIFTELKNIDFKIKWLLDRCDRLERSVIKNGFDIKQLQQGEDQ